MKTLKPLLEQLNKFYKEADSEDLYGDRESFILKAIDHLEDAVACENTFDLSEFVESMEARD